ncbi:Essential protein Yae1, N terminal [Coniochaeta pulveracea]|uniref:Protein YAE1 n=1 Tax=Coniochaeta pulveracea TaxID=177199 RepID=A0A420YKY7_9PEZI|nr:Essential protein Yae1, N terminal [Coniochaeta pulveracea]
MLLRPEDPDLLIMASESPSPPSPELYPQTIPSQPSDDNNLDDVWGSSPSSPSLTPSTHPSDIHRLQQEHSTAGYRDGITNAKAASAQKGFDEGFGLGAVIGSRCGLVLGLLEGVVNALSAETEGRKEVEGLLVEARKELDVVSVFGREYWDGEGVWKYEVKGDGGEGEVLFADVAGAHPLVRKWAERVREVVERYGIDVKVLEEDDVKRDGQADEGGREVRRDAKAVGARGKEVLEW